MFRAKSSQVYNKGQWIVGHYANRDGVHHIYIPGTNLSFFVDPKTLGQYTGLKDADRQKIFEGDILSVKNSSYKYIVEFQNGAFCIASTDGVELLGWKENISDSPYDGSDIFWGIEKSNIPALSEVIGNIHDNPELLAPSPT